MAPSRTSLLCLIAAAVCCTAAADLVVSTTNGPVSGAQVGNAEHWLGIPYAASTAGENRFMPPQPVQPWTAPLDTTAYGPGCVQTGHNADVPKVQSEDCLFLNVFRPAWANATSKLPVMLFFHGGAFIEGDSKGPFGMYNSDYIVGTKDVIAVTANYRLGAFGWLVTGTSVPGNQGFQDQVAAMKWVQKNIAAFGGDASRVTLWGESAGAMSGGLHLVSPASKGLFSQLIMESNPSGFRYRDVKDNALYGNKVCDLLNCTVGSTCNMTCMQHTTTAQVEHAWSKTGGDFIIIAEANWGHLLDAILMCTPTIDGTLIPENPMVALPAGRFTQGIPMLFGTNNNEGSTFVYAALSKPLSPILYDLALDVLFGKTKANEIADRYKYINLPDARTVLSRIITDWWFRCASEQFAVYNTKAGTPAYVYVFDHILSDPELFPKFGLPAVCSNRTCHGAELPFVFHFTTIQNSQVNFTMTPVEQQLSQSFVDYWTSFAIHGDPNVGNTQPVLWPQYSIGGRENIILEDAISTENATNLCGFWDTIGYDY